ncbi:MAG: tRNA (adenosine(37)-N6)-threonylcarbamoyltransferase complex ATPase subunit type 1 TsaE [Lactobacillales bacterium]|jgi:tRNA threonylcarbamoyladenosine biosynthesis protein TsaE|nr:tRNA (adenosine(37)-N6)-threonylcarbamoyltransferase complex ATPase subunit type 1 TsaE [Lactobacillales bacterium]
MEVILKSVSDTEDLGQVIGATAPTKALIILSGDLGAGKTTLTKAIAKGLGVKEHIKSPTYTIVREYDRMNHMDVYRVGGGDLFEIGLDEYLEQDKVNIIEWGDLIDERDLPEDFLRIHITGSGDLERTVEISGGEEWTKLQSQLGKLGLMMR